MSEKKPSKKTGKGATTRSNEKKKKDTLKQLAQLMESKTKRYIEGAQWENPICHITVIPHEHQTPDFCRYMNMEDNPQESLYTKYSKVVLQERFLNLLKKAKARKGVA